jgi:protein-S-isoprenylcysteine O-methyltransferase Ste14
MRHPGYAGTIVTYLATPLMLDSAWAFIPAVILCVLLIVRTRLEDRFLQDNLEGYAGYAQRTRFRLFPGIW